MTTVRIVLYATNADRCTGDKETNGLATVTVSSAKEFVDVVNNIDTNYSLAYEFPEGLPLELVEHPPYKQACKYLGVPYSLSSPRI